MPTPELTRDIIRHANRANIDAEGVIDLCHLADRASMLVKESGDLEYLTGENLVRLYLESFED